MSQVRQGFGTTTAVIGSLFRGASIAVTSYLAHAATPNPAAVQQNNSIYLLANTANTMIVSIELYNLITHLIASNAWKHMTVAEKVSIGLLITAGGVCSGYSFWRLSNSTPQLFAAGSSAAAGATFFALAATVTNHAVRRQRYESSDSLPLLGRF